MPDDKRPIDKVLKALQERAKELTCLYRVEELLRDPDAPLDTVFGGILEAIPPGWQYSEACEARIIHEDSEYATEGFCPTPWMMSAEITVQEHSWGGITVVYTEEFPEADSGPFFAEEQKLLNTIADRLGYFLQYRRIHLLQTGMSSAAEDSAAQTRGEWKIIADLLRRTDQNLYRRILRKLFIRLRSSGIQEAIELQERLLADRIPPSQDNRPSQKYDADFTAQYSAEVFSIATRHFPDSEILSWFQKWIQQDRSSFLVSALESSSTTLSDVADALRRFQQSSAEGMELSPSTDKEVRVALIQRFFTDQLEYINVAKEYVDVRDFYQLLPRIIYPTGSHGKLGGKSAGVFLASRIVQKAAQTYDILRNVKTPKTWHITSDGILSFVTHNDLDELVEHKYREIEEVQRDYDHIVQVFKHSRFTPEIVQGLSMALDDFEDHPIIVRSSSLLEDRFGAAFSGKYKSLFLANQGTKQQRLEALMDAIAEVYSSTFGPDPIQYRAERGLLDFREEMGIMIQEVVGKRVGRYFFPAFAGVAFSNNEFRWSPRIRRDDGLLRLVPGLGTRAVDRLSDDYPVLIAPGQPHLRVNASPEEVIRYSPGYMDVINLDTNAFETVEVREMIREYGGEIPWLGQVASIIKDGHIRIPDGLMLDVKAEDFCITFEGLIAKTAFIRQMQIMLRLLQEKLGTPVDMEFASDGTDFYILQCRPQAFSTGNVPSPIPRDFPADQVIFTAKRYVSNGRLPDITHIVYVDPLRYSDVEDLPTLHAIGRCVGRLNSMLPKRRFILMGPGRWGSHGDIKLGVNVGYSEIKNTAMLIEIARKKGNYVPDLSFGTHFFQDLVESNIRYLPLYPDDAGILFNEEFLLNSPNTLTDLLPEDAPLNDVIRVINVPEASDGRVLRILMNADLDEAIGLLSIPSAKIEELGEPKPVGTETSSEEHSRWRMMMVERIAEHLDPMQFGARRIYVIGNTNNGTADAGSDVDLLIEFDGSPEQRERFLSWLDGWSGCLAEMNFMRTGHRLPRLLDVRLFHPRDRGQQPLQTAREVPIKSSS